MDAFLGGGGNLLRLGGNGLFERCVLQEGGTPLLFFDGDPTRGRGPFYFRNADPPRPEGAVLGVAFLFDVPGPPSPYRVVKGTHPFFRGTGLKDGDLFGASGRNGGASGWEMDSSDPGTQPAGVTVAAPVGNASTVDANIDLSPAAPARIRETSRSLLAIRPNPAS